MALGNYFNLFIFSRNVLTSTAMPATHKLQGGKYTQCVDSMRYNCPF